MPDETPLISDDDITVTSATERPAQAETPVEKPAEKPAEGAAAGAEQPAGEAAVEKPAGEAAVEDDEDPEVQAELDKIEPPKPGETPAEKKARNRRSQKVILKNIGLRKDAEKKAADLQRKLDDLQRTPPSAGDKKADDPPAAGTKAASEPTFEFPSWEKYQEDHPEAAYEEYQDARSDARYAFNRDKDAAVARTTAREASERKLTEDFLGHEATFKATHADYDDVLAAATFPESPAVPHVQKLIARAGALGPAILYHIASHPEDAKALFEAPSPGALLEAFGELKATVKGSSAAAPAPGSGASPKPAAPPKPSSDAPAPVSGLPGGAHTGRSLASVAADNEDADEYIGVRTQQLRAGARR